MTRIGAMLAVALAALPAAAQPMLRVPDNREGWPIGFCVHQIVQQEGPATQALDDLGAPWVRIDANWNEIEPQQGVFDWTLMDRMVDTARAHGAIVYATLAYTPEWATAGTVRNGVPLSADYYRGFVSAVVTRYRDRVKHWGLWNEPEQAHFWAGTAQELVDLVLRPGFEAVRAADAGALVLGPDSGGDDWLDAIFAAGGGAYLDVITVHVYACCDDTDDVAKVLLRLDCTGGWPWDTCRRKVIENHGLGDKPVWVTEVGWKTLTPDWEQKQASYYVGLLDAMLARPWWHKTIFYELFDATPCDPLVDNCWGIVGQDWTRKPAFAAVRDYLTAHQPRAEAGPDRTAAPGAPVTFDGSGSHDPDGQIVRYRWDFDRADGVTEEASGVTVSHAYPAAGTYVATLVVTDTHGLEDADTVTVQVGGAPARPTIRAPRATQPLVIDGVVDDWDFRGEVQIGAADYVSLTAPTTGDQDLSARVLAMWDEDSLYLAAIVTDDAHVNGQPPESLWDGDSWQIAVDADHDLTAGGYDADGDTEAGFALLGADATTYRWVAPPGAPAWDPETAAVVNAQGQLVIEARIPFAALPPAAPAVGATFGLSFLFNDDDGAGRKGFIEWTSGVGVGKDPSQFGDLVLGGGPCETDQACGTAADCVGAPATCQCAGFMTCNAGGRCEWQCGPPPDGGAADAPPAGDGPGPVGDGGAGTDAGTRAAGGGCGCRAGGQGGASGLFAALVLGALVRRGRRRQAGR